MQEDGSNSDKEDVPEADTDEEDVPEEDTDEEDVPVADTDEEEGTENVEEEGDLIKILESCQTKERMQLSS